MAIFTGVSKREARLRRGSLVGMLAALAFALMTLLRPFASIQWRLSDQLFVGNRPSDAIVIAAIDDASLAKHGRWAAWPRSLHATAIDNLKAAGARVIGLDLILAERTDDDAELAEAMTRAGNVVLVVAGTTSASERVGALHTYTSLLSPTPELAEAAAALGHANVPPDGDGVVRRLPLQVADRSGNRYPAFALAVMHRFFSRQVPVDLEAKDGAVHLLQRDVPIDGRMATRINFAELGGFYRLSYADVIANTFDPALVKHKMVLVGLVATGEHDAWTTPVSQEKMFGVEVQASAMDTILRGRFLTETGMQTDFLLTFLLAGGAAAFAPRLRLRWGVPLGVAVVVAYYGGAFFAFDSGHILNMLYPPLGVVITFGACLLHRIIAEEAHRREVSSLFGRYVSPQVADELMQRDDEGSLSLGGELREVTVLFCDIRGFTGMSEGMTPKAVMDMLNGYLSLIIDRVIANEGMVNKFAGDSIMAVWNAPKDQPEHALMAVRAATESQMAVKRFREANQELPQAQFGFGINTGEAIAGSMGSSGRAEYTVIGDSVNLASRLCGAAPGDETWIGSRTRDLLQDQAEVEALGPQTFKGKAEPVAVYRIVGIAS